MEMLMISKEEHLLSKPVFLATSSQANDFFLLSLKSTKVLSYKAGYFLTASLNQFLSTFYFIFCFFFYLLLSYISHKTLKSLLRTRVCYFTIHAIKLQMNFWSILRRVRKLLKFFDILRTVCLGYITLRQVCSRLSFVCVCVSACVCLCIYNVNPA